MADRTELELALSVAEMVAKGILEEWEHLDEDGRDDPSNKAVHQLATDTLKAVSNYREYLDGLSSAIGEQIEEL